MAWAKLDNMPWDQCGKALNFPLGILGSPREQEIKADGSCWGLELAHIQQDKVAPNFLTIQCSHIWFMRFTVSDAWYSQLVQKGYSQKSCSVKTSVSVILTSTLILSKGITTVWWKNYSWRSRPECFLQVLWFSGRTWEVVEESRQWGSWRENQGCH